MKKIIVEISDCVHFVEYKICSEYGHKEVTGILGVWKHYPEWIMKVIVASIKIITVQKIAHKNMDTEIPKHSSVDQKQSFKVCQIHVKVIYISICGHS